MKNIDIKNRQFSGDNNNREIFAGGDLKAYLYNSTEDSILYFNIEGYGEFNLYCDYGVTFILPTQYGEDDIVTSDINNILKCMKNFGSKIGIINLFGTEEEKLNTFYNMITSYVEKLRLVLSKK